MRPFLILLVLIKLFPGCAAAPKKLKADLAAAEKPPSQIRQIAQAASYAKKGAPVCGRVGWAIESSGLELKNKGEVYGGIHTSATAFVRDFCDTDKKFFSIGSDSSGSTICCVRK